MPIPTPAFTSAHVRSELGLATAFTSAQVGAGIGSGSAFLSSELAGYSAITANVAVITLTTSSSWVPSGQKIYTTYRGYTTSYRGHSTKSAPTRGARSPTTFGGFTVVGLYAMEIFDAPYALTLQLAGDQTGIIKKFDSVLSTGGGKTGATPVIYTNPNNGLISTLLTIGTITTNVLSGFKVTLTYYT